MLRKVEDKLVLFVANNFFDRNLIEHSIIEMPFPTIFDIRDWGKKEFKNQFIQKFSQNPKPLVVKFDEEEIFSSLQSQKFMIEGIYIVNKQYDHNQLVFELDKSGLGPSHLEYFKVKPVTHEGKLAFLGKKMTTEKKNAMIINYFKQIYLHGDMGADGTYV